jgi:hypothetical protein
MLQAEAIKPFTIIFPIIINKELKPAWEELIVH